MIVQPKLVPVAPGNLRQGTTYVTPGGRLCRLVPPGRGSQSDGNSFDFEYVDAKVRDPLNRDGFVMARSNVSLLCEVRR